VGTDLLRLLIAAVVVGEEEEESRTVRGGIETDVACLASAWLHRRWLLTEVRRAVGRWQAQGRRRLVLSEDIPHELLLVIGPVALRWHSV
jgi:hypothetical protein